MGGGLLHDLFVRKCIFILIMKKKKENDYGHYLNFTNHLATNYVFISYKKWV
jgi:hypothetical protein